MSSCLEFYVIVEQITKHFIVRNCNFIQQTIFKLKTLKHFWSDNHLSIETLENSFAKNNQMTS